MPEETATLEIPASPTRVAPAAQAPLDVRVAGQGAQVSTLGIEAPRMSDKDSSIAQIDTPGGHIVVCLLLIGIAVGMFFLKVPEYKDIIVGATAVLFAAMRGKGGAK